MCLDGLVVVVEARLFSPKIQMISVGNARMCPARKLLLGLCESFVDVGGAVALPKLRPVAERLVDDLSSLHIFWNHHSFHV